MCDFNYSKVLVSETYLTKNFIIIIVIITKNNMAIDANVSQSTINDIVYFFNLSQWRRITLTMTYFYSFLNLCLHPVGEHSQRWKEVGDYLPIFSRKDFSWFHEHKEISAICLSSPLFNEIFFLLQTHGATTSYKRRIRNRSRR